MLRLDLFRIISHVSEKVLASTLNYLEGEGLRSPHYTISCLLVLNTLLRLSHEISLGRIFTEKLKKSNTFQHWKNCNT